MKIRLGFLVALAVSLVIHAALVMFVPSPSPEAVPRKEEYHIVELRRIPIPLPDLPPVPQTRPIERPDPGPPPLPPAPDKSRLKPAGLSLEEMAHSARLPEVKALLPSAPATVPDLVAKSPLLPPDRIGRGKAPRGTPEGTRLGGEWRVPSPLSAAQTPLGDRLKTLGDSLIREELLRAAKARPSEGEIGGPVASRDLVFRPPPPAAPVSAEGEIELKFWVLPDGTVGRIVLLRRGDLALEAAAIQNLKQWKFNSLPPDVRVPEQWGTLRFRFLSAAATPQSSMKPMKPSLE